MIQEVSIAECGLKKDEDIKPRQLKIFAFTTFSFLVY
jgi:hypothetical protein